VTQHTSDFYAGAPISKFPEDLRVYEHLLWDMAPNVVIELGIRHGGSGLWFRDRLRTLEAYGRIAAYHVICVDVDIDQALPHLERADPRYRETMTFLKGDVCDPAAADEVERLLPDSARCFVIEDSAHVYETTYGALENFSRFTPPGGYFVVEDGCVDVEPMRLRPDWPRGVLPALHDWLRTEKGQGFKVRRELELYGLTCHPEGFLQRVR
jgi:cephalosporin hydroxylase